MRFHTYSKFSPEMADAVDLQSLLDKLADFLLQSGFAGGPSYHPYWGETGSDGDRSLDAFVRVIHPHPPRGRTYGRAASPPRRAGARKDHE